MIITLIVVGLLITGIACLVAYENIRRCSESVFVVGVISTLISGIALICIIIGIISVQISKDVDYQNVLYEREMLEYRIDNMDEDIVGNEMLYNDIVEFNNELRSVKKWATNPWTNWFNNQDIATIDYIELNSD